MSGNIEVEVVPTVTLGSAVACVTMLNMFLRANEDYMLIWANGEYRLTDDSRLGNGAR